MAGDARRTRSEPHEHDEIMGQMFSYIYANLPDYPLYQDHRPPPALAASDRVDRISRLPREVRREIVSRLPVKDAARTAVLSRRWRTIWLSTPLVLIDAHLLPKAQGFPPTAANTPAVTAAVSTIFQAHPGPFSCVHLICSRMTSYRAQLARWLQLLATKGVQDLVLVNRALPREVAVPMPLPSTVFSITTLTRLYLGIWKLPGTADLRGASFPHLRELGILFVEMEPGDVDSLVARSPVLEILNILGCMKGLRLRLVSLKFWEESGPLENVVSRIKVMSLREFTGEPGEVGFLEFIFQSARVLKTAIIVTANPDHTPFFKDLAFNKAMKSSRNMASESCQRCYVGSTGPKGGEVWNFKAGAEFSLPDPFSVFEVLTRF